MKPFPVKSQKLSGSSNIEIIKKAQDYFKLIERETKRQPYVRSAFFGKQKIFFTFFWKHLYQKSPKERRRRLQYFLCAIELIENSRNTPTMKPNPNKKSEILYRFYGITKDKEIFYTQVKENITTKRLELMSIVIPDLY